MRPYKAHTRVDDATVTWVRERLRQGQRLRDIAQHTPYLAGDLDLALWDHIADEGGPPEPMFD